MGKRYRTDEEMVGVMKFFPDRTKREVPKEVYGFMHVGDRW
jgi:hypothetical protein